MKNATLTRLSAKLDATLIEFKLAPNESGQYPWQEAQEKNRTRRIVAAGAGAAAIGAGAYAAKRGVEALKGRYGVASGKDALTVGAEEARQKVAAAAAPYVDKLKGGVNRAGQAVQPAMDKVTGAVKSGADSVEGALNTAGKAVVRKGKAAWTAGARGIAQRQGLGTVIKRVGRALIRAEVGRGMPPLVALEAKLDRALGL